ncbi:hypothetical protein [Prevotella sp. S7 MS 2]|uniref:hypothetical protein n=1 Tax=Prevotella sp. S7 MS 2 TaxID=1287488 RepID=UPI000513B79D|nr:hypothetical protein [Prevotella sp. S7 MS 2]KGI59760.1 hypothetical protein HMPREF0671_09780 [Prevotella sp. S7 MS 2]
MKAIKAMRQAAVTVTAAVALALTGCSGQEDFIDGGDTPAKGVMLTMTASTGVAGPDGTRAYLTEGDDKNPWLWEDKDELLVVNDAGKAIGTLTIKKGIGKEKGVFEGPVDGLTAGQKVRIFYLGPNTNTSRIVNGKIMFDFSKLDGKHESLKSLCALNAEGTVKMNGDKAGILEDVTLKNAFAAAHFSVKGKYDPLLGSTYKALVVHGDVPLQATVDAASGNIESTVMAGRESNVREGFVFTTAASPDKPYDIYLPLVPNKEATDKATISFDIYTDKQTSKKIVSAGAEPATVGNSADAFVRTAAGTPSVFTVSDNGKKVNFTDGNLQYMMPKQVYSLTVRKHISPNTLYRKGKDNPQELEAKYNVLKGYYRLAPKQWIMVPPTSYANNYYFGIYTCTQDNKGAWNVSCTTNPVFDMFFFGKPEQPTLVDKSPGKYFQPTAKTEYQGKDQDWTKYAKLGDSNDPLVTPSLSDWQYLFDTRTFPDDKSTPAFALAFLDLNGNGTVERNVDQAGIVIFPDGMNKSTAMSLFTAPNGSTFGKRTLETNVESGNLGKILKMEAVTEKGCLFLPFPGWNNGYNGSECKIEQIGRHFNYWTSTSLPILQQMYHYNITIDATFGSKGGVSGNAVRLVRVVK